MMGRSQEVIPSNQEATLRRPTCIEKDAHLQYQRTLSILYRSYLVTVVITHFIKMLWWIWQLLNFRLINPVPHQFRKWWLHYVSVCPLPRHSLIPVKMLVFPQFPPNLLINTFYPDLWGLNTMIINWSLETEVINPRTLFMYLSKKMFFYCCSIQSGDT